MYCRILIAFESGEPEPEFTRLSLYCIDRIAIVCKCIKSKNGARETIGVRAVHTSTSMMRKVRLRCKNFSSWFIAKTNEPAVN